MLKFITYGTYVYAPLISFVCWLGMILGLLLWWAVTDDAPRYDIDDATIPYISTLGAYRQWLFILGCSLTAAFYVLTLFFERWLRHVDRIPGTVRSRERTLDILCVVFGCIGALALVLLSCFKSTRFETVHWTFTAIFIVAIALSCLFQTWEMFALKEDHPDRAHLRRNAIMKAVIITLAFAGAIAFVGLYASCRNQPNDQPLSASCNRQTSAAAVLEWTIAVLYGFYVLTFVLDLWPAAKTSPRYLRRTQGPTEKPLMVESSRPSMAATEGRTDSDSMVQRPTEAERASYYNQHADYYSAPGPQPVHNPEGVAMRMPSAVEDPSGRV